MRKLAVLAAMAALLGGAAVAEAATLGRPCTSAPESQWLSMEDLKAKVEAAGYKVEKSKLKNACAEFYARDKSGSRIELFVDPTSGSIVGQMPVGS